MKNRVASHTQIFTYFKLVHSYFFYVQVSHFERYNILLHIFISVGFTAIGSGYGTRSPGYQLKFPVIKSSVGITNLSSMKTNGTFICEKKGLYLITVTVMVCSAGDSEFKIYKNNQLYMNYYVGRSDRSKQDCHSGSGTAVVELHSYDTLNVRNSLGGVEMYESYASFSAAKLK